MLLGVDGIAVVGHGGSRRARRRPYARRRRRRDGLLTAARRHRRPGRARRRWRGGMTDGARRRARRRRHRARVDPARSPATRLVEDLRRLPRAGRDRRHRRGALPGRTIEDAALDEIRTVGEAVDYAATRGGRTCRARPQRPPHRLEAARHRRRPDLLERALTHRSYAYENGGLPTNERLEFLGDSVLGVVVTDRALPQPPRPARGPARQAARQRGQHARARRRGPRPRTLGPYLLLGKGEETTGGRDKASILADTLEALLGAIYLEHGLDAARRR